MRRIFPCFLVVTFFILSCSPPPHLRRSVRSNGSFHGSGERKKVVRTAKKYLGVPYRYGGTTPRGFDCSGFVTYVFKKNGIPVSRSATAQYHNGKRVSRWRLQPGDLVFFQTGRKRISHVGIYVGSRRFIHAPRTGKRISYADLNNRYWKKRYRGAVSYFSSRIFRTGHRNRKQGNRTGSDFTETVHYF